MMWRLAAALAVLAVVFSPPAEAENETKLSIKPTGTKGRPVFRLSNQDTSILIKMPKLETMIWRLQMPMVPTPEGIKKATLYDDSGNVIEYRILADAVSGLIIGTHLPGVTIDLAKVLKRNGQTRFVVSGRNADGTPINLKKEDLALIDLKHRNQCFALEELGSGSVRASVVVAVDNSGSMGDALPDIKVSLVNFVQNAPAGAECRIHTFNGGSTSLHPPSNSRPGRADSPHDLNATSIDDYYYQCSEFTSNFLNRHISAGGGTDIINALTPLYEGALDRKADLNFILVISDGLGSVRSAKNRQFAQLQALRDQAVEEAAAYTIVNWLGAFNTNYPLARLAHYNIFGRAPDQPFAQDFFAQSSQLLKNQKVMVKTDTCARQNANPPT